MNLTSNCLSCLSYLLANVTQNKHDTFYTIDTFCYDTFLDYTNDDWIYDRIYDPLYDCY